MSSMIFGKRGRLTLMVHADAPLGEQDWARYLDDLRKNLGPDVLTLVYTDGPSPNARQRTALNQLVGGRVLRTSIVSSSVLVRGVVTALSWFNPGIRAFLPHEERLAHDHLGLDEAEREWITEALPGLIGRVTD